ncbi:MAG: hypothetical protein ACR2PH_17045 [Desulfobulbia bacterium]
MKILVSMVAVGLLFVSHALAETPKMDCNYYTNGAFTKLTNVLSHLNGVVRFGECDEGELWVNDAKITTSVALANPNEIVDSYDASMEFLMGTEMHYTSKNCTGELYHPVRYKICTDWDMEVGCSQYFVIEPKFDSNFSEFKFTPSEIKIIQTCEKEVSEFLGV